MTLTIVGLGPGPVDLITRRAWAALEAAQTVVVLNEQVVPVSELPVGPRYVSLSEPVGGHQDQFGQWQSVSTEIIALAGQGDVVLALLGNPVVDEPGVDVMRREAEAAGLATSIVEGISLADSACSALGLDARRGLQVFQAASVADMHHPPFSPAVPVLLTRIEEVDIRSLRRVLLNQYPADHSVMTVVTAPSGAVQVLDSTVGSLDAMAFEVATAALLIPVLAELGSFAALQETMAHLRSPQGCPWDREQTHDSLRPYLLEETYEALEALDAGDVNGLKEELGDLLLQVAFHTQVAVDKGEFHMADVIHYINSKLIHRHPHVWGEIDVNDSADVARNWEAIKKEERKENGNGKASLLDGVSKALPALAQAFNYQARAARVGFDWEQIDPVIDKIGEEVEEIRSAADPAHRAREIGDLLFALVNWIRWMDVEPETVLREANARFYRRFHFIEMEADRMERKLQDMTLQELDALWDAAKAQGL